MKNLKQWMSVCAGILLMGIVAVAQEAPAAAAGDDLQAKRDAKKIELKAAAEACAQMDKSILDPWHAADGKALLDARDAMSKALQEAKKAGLNDPSVAGLKQAFEEAGAGVTKAMEEALKDVPAFQTARTALEPLEKREAELIQKRAELDYARLQGDRRRNLAGMLEDQVSAEREKTAMTALNKDFQDVDAELKEIRGKVADQYRTMVEAKKTANPATEALRGARDAGRAAGKALDEALKALPAVTAVQVEYDAANTAYNTARKAVLESSAERKDLVQKLEQVNNEIREIEKQIKAAALPAK